MKPLQWHLRLALILLVGMLALPWQRAGAQEENTPEFRLNVRRNFGYSSGSQIRGRFTNSIVGPVEKIQSVTYLIDGQEMATVTEPPFSYTYQTDDYALGWHDLSALVRTQDGRTVETPTRRFQFVSPEEEFAGVRRIIFPVLGGVILLMVLVMGAQMLFLREKTLNLPLGTPRQYGLRGGTICKRCGRPFAIHLWALNFGPWKLDRCDFCGKWAMVTRLPLEALRAAEQAELAAAAPQEPAGRPKPEDELRKKLDDTRYIDSDG